MYYKVLETDEILNDLEKIAFSAYEYTKDVESGKRFLDLYNTTIANMSRIPLGFSGVGFDYRGYEIHMLPFGNYNMFYVIKEEVHEIVMLRTLYQKQDWRRILHLENIYHRNGKII